MPYRPVLAGKFVQVPPVRQLLPGGYFQPPLRQVLPGGLILSGGSSGPVNTNPPTIAVVGGGQPYAGEVLECTPGTWTGSPILTYQWRRNGVAIEGEGNPAGYTIQAEDVGQTITILEIPNGQTGQGVASEQIVPLPDIPVNTNPPGISADGSEEGATLTYDGGDTWEPEPDSKTWSWQKDGVTVSGEPNLPTWVASQGAGAYRLSMNASNAGGSSAETFSNSIEIS